MQTRGKRRRGSLLSTLQLLARLGLPVTAFFVAINPIWGFSWYFNTESWASGVYQKLTELRVDRLAGREWSTRRLQRRPARTRSTGRSRIDRPPGVDERARLQLPGDRRYRRGRSRRNIRWSRAISHVGSQRGREVPGRRLRRDLSGGRDEPTTRLNFYLPFQGLGPSRSTRSPAITTGSTRSRGSTPTSWSPRRRARAALRARVEADLRLHEQPIPRPHRAADRCRAARGCGRLYGIRRRRKQTGAVLRAADRRVSRSLRSTPASCAASTRGSGPGSKRALATQPRTSWRWRSSGIRSFAGGHRH